MFVALLLFFTRLLIILFPLSLAAHILKLMVQRKGRSEESNLIKTRREFQKSIIFTICAIASGNSNFNDDYILNIQ